MIRRVALVALGALLVAGCGGGSSDDERDAVAPASTSSTTSEPTATVGQIAGIVAQHHQELLEALDDASPCLSAVFPEDCRGVALIRRLSADVQSQTLVLQLRGAGSKASPTYIGEYPDELEPLVDDTLSVAEQFHSRLNDRKRVCDDQPSKPDCDRVLVELMQITSSLESTLRRWQPYL